MKGAAHHQWQFLVITWFLLSPELSNGPVIWHTLGRAFVGKLWQIHGIIPLICVTFVVLCSQSLWNPARTSLSLEPRASGEHYLLLPQTRPYCSVLSWAGPNYTSQNLQPGSDWTHLPRAVQFLHFLDLQTCHKFDILRMWDFQLVWKLWSYWRPEI